ncbi:ureidoglycolate hydrolase, partial [Tanacetum coccineum]
LPNIKKESLKTEADEENSGKFLVQFTFDFPVGCCLQILCFHALNAYMSMVFIKNLMGLSGLSIREDDVGNILGRWEGSEPGLQAVSAGSHIDAIPYSGKYDGVVGVLGAMEAINVLK